VGTGIDGVADVVGIGVGEIEKEFGEGDAVDGATDVTT
jgi:hypothetical protein